jgi:hypothetical protein
VVVGEDVPLLVDEEAGAGGVPGQHRHHALPHLVGDGDEVTGGYGTRPGQ